MAEQEAISFNIKDVFEKEGLYTQIPITEENISDILGVLFYISESHDTHRSSPMFDNLVLDIVCPICKTKKSFSSIANEHIGIQQLIINDSIPNEYGEKTSFYNRHIVKKIHKDRFFIRKFRCASANDGSHDIAFIFKVENNTLSKIGQYPSLADINKSSIEKYKNTLHDEYEELSKAIGLFSHGIGIGSFVYLRRIVELHIVIPKLKELGIELDSSKNSFKYKLKEVKGHISEYLTETPIIYSLLSKGIHQWKEKECKDAFLLLLSAIELVLDEEIALREQRKKRTEITKGLQTLSTEK